jgi:hypothetical protein
MNARGVLAVLLILASVGAVHAETVGRVDGEVIGKVLGRQPIRDSLRGPCTVYTVATYFDSSYVAIAPTHRDTIELWTVGDERMIRHEDTLFGPLGSVTMALGEKVRVLYRTMDGHPYLVNKWTVWWRRGGPRGDQAWKERTAVERAEGSLERFLSASSRMPGFADSLELRETKYVDDVWCPLAQWKKWTSYHLLWGPGITLRAQRQAEAVADVQKRG